MISERLSTWAASLLQHDKADMKMIWRWSTSACQPEISITDIMLLQRDKDDLKMVSERLSICDQVRVTDIMEAIVFKMINIK